MTTGEYLATGGAEPVGAWARVSTGGQDETNQEPDIQRHAAEHGQRIVKWYRLNDKSAKKGEQQKALNEVIADMASGLIKALICWHSDRLDRRGPKAGYAFLYAVELVKGRIESVLDPDFGKDDVGSEVLTTIRMATARDESDLKSKRTRIGFATIDANGAIRNKAGYGYRITGRKYHHHFELVDDEAEVIRLAASRYLDEKSNQSLAHVCHWLTVNGHLGRNGAAWTPKTLGNQFRSETLIGRYHQGDVVARVPAILTVKQHNALVAKMDAKGYRLACVAARIARSPRFFLREVRAEDVSGRQGCRILLLPSEDGISCKMLVSIKEADAEVIEGIGETIVVAYRTREVVIPGHDYADDVAQLKLDLADLSREAGQPGWLARVTEINAEIERLSVLDPEPDEVVTREVDTVAEANAWQALPYAEKRQRLIDTGVKLVANRDDDGNVNITIKRSE